jgi:hypothetical protein
MATMPEPEPRECPEEMRSGFTCCYASDGYMHYWIDGVEVSEQVWNIHQQARDGSAAR